MVHFDFVLENDEAELIMGIISKEIASLIIFAKDKENDKAERDWAKRHSDLLTSIQKRMRNSTV